MNLILDKLQSNMVPYYHQIKEMIRRRIEDGTLQPGHVAPTEAELQNYFKVSRATVRQALQGLVNEGLLTRQRGKGTFVAQPKLTENLPRLSSFTEEMQAKGVTWSTRVLSVGHVEPPQRVKELLRMKDGEAALKVDRLRLVGQEPLVLLSSYIAPWIGVAEHEDFSGSLYDILEHRYRVRLSMGDQVIGAAGAGREDARLLRCKPGAPLLCLERTTYAHDGRSAEFVQARYRSDRYHYYVQLHR
ncbi:MAG TPA: GntR family transcriptional regulator [Symbiobacteriaceae bacterium]|nr:GntR family transcriptional regulator [Symbiobacteriaceae bacterium]